MSDGSLDASHNTAPASPSRHPPERAHFVRGSETGYDAFISYSHAVDGQLAPALQLGLQRFAKPWYQRRALRVFRDEASLAADPGLWTAIRAALQQSNFFILLASPEAARSKWVAKEADFWCTHKSPSTLLIALTDGSIAWDETRSDFDWAHSNAVPETLRARVPEEPRWIDLRWVRQHEDVSLRHPRFRESVAELAAPIHGRPKDDLVGDDVRQHRRTVRLARLAVGGLVFLFVVAALAAVLAVRQRDAVRRERDLTASRLLAAQAQGDLDDRLDRSFLLSLEALRTGAVSEGRSSLLAALNRGSRLKKYLRPPGSTTAPTPTRIEGITDAGIRAGFVAVTPDDKTVLASGRDGSISFWDIESGTESAPPLLNEGFKIFSLALSPDGKILAIGGEGVRESDEILLWDLQSRRRIGEPLNAPGEVASTLIFSPDGRFLVSWGPYGKFGLWDMSDRSLVAHVGYGANSATAAISPDGGTLAVTLGRADVDDVLLWDVERRAAIGPPLIIGHVVDALAFSPDGRLLAVGRADGTVDLWDIHRGEAIGQSLDASDPADTSLLFSPDGRILAVGGSDDGVITLWDMESYEPLGGPLRGHDRVATGLAFSADGRSLASAGVDEAVILWDITERTTLARALRGGHSSIVASTAVSVAGLVASGDSGGRIVVWDAATGTRRTAIEVPGSPWIWDLAFSPDGQLLASGLDDRGGPVRFWNPDTGEPAGAALIGHTDRPKPRHEGSDGTRIAFTPDGRHLVSGGIDGGVIVWDVESRAQVGERLALHEAAVTAVAVSPDGKTVASGDQDGTIILSELSSRFGQATAARAHGGPVTSLSFGSDGRTLASGGEDSSILLWPVHRRMETSTRLGSHESDVRGLEFSPSGDVLVSGGGDEELILWDTRSRRQMGEPLAGHQGRIWSVAFSTDGRYVVAGDASGLVLLWDTDLLSWQRRACAIANRSFTTFEWEQLVGRVPYHQTCPGRGQKP